MQLKHWVLAKSLRRVVGAAGEGFEPSLTDLASALHCLSSLYFAVDLPFGRVFHHLLEALANMQPAEWMTTEQAAKYLGCGSVKAFEKVVYREGIPKHYLSVRAPRYNCAELDEWLLGRRQRVRR